MGTRSLTVVVDEENREILTLYRQFDGYPEGHGKELATFLDGFKVVNGISSYEEPKLANGAGCLAAQIVAHFKRATKFKGKKQYPVGNVYIYPAGSRDVGEEFIYTVQAAPGNAVWIVVQDRYTQEAFAGTPEQILATIQKRAKANA